MLKYLIILLGSNSPSICRYDDNASIEASLIPLKTLKDGITFALKQNLIIQYVWPKSVLPNDYLDVIAHSNHVNIAPVSLARQDDISVIKITDEAIVTDKILICTLTTEEFISHSSKIIYWLTSCKRLNILLQGRLADAASEKAYDFALSDIAQAIHQLYKGGHMVQFNLLTDRIFLSKMNNCNAGIETITLAPDANFYICPAFYNDRLEPIGNLTDGLKIKNEQLLKLEYAPICRICDAYHCTRCIYENKKATLELNTPGHKQCVMSHIERNASARLSKLLIEDGILSPSAQFAEVDCLDPFYKLPRIRLK